LVNRPRVLLFDEANASMDSRGDTILHSVLKGLKGRCTLVLVSHRPSTLKLADHIYDLVDGRLIHRKPQQQQDPAHAELRKPA
jgi:ATP-binding cassette subfamily C protein LapB